MSRILIVDDLEANLYLLESLLQGHGYQVEKASNGAQALEKALAAPPDLIISDILMPVMDGFSLCREWQMDIRTQSIPFIFYTATYTEAKDEELARNLGAARFLVKPLDPDDFIQQVRNVLVALEAGQLTTPHRPTSGESAILRQYNERLIKKLEDKLLQLKETKRSLEADINVREQVELALRESEEHYRKLIEASPDGITIIGVDGLISYVSTKVLDVFGYGNESEIIGQSPLNWIDTEDRERAKNNIADVFQEIYSTHNRYRLLKKDGTKFWGDINATRLKDVRGNPSGIVAITRDVSEQVRTEEMLRRQAQIIDQVHEAIIATDLEGLIVGWNASAERMLGYPAVEALGKPISFIYPQDQLPLLTEKFQPYVRQKGWHETETRLRSKSGKEFPAHIMLAMLKDSQGMVIGFAGSAIDITERKRVEKALKESEERLRLSTEFANVAVWEYSFINNSMSRSKNHDRLYGLEWQTVWEYDTFLNATYPEDREFSNEMIQNSVAVGGPDEYRFDFRVVYPDQSIHWLFVVGQVVERNQEGQGTLVRGTLIDITERKIVEEALQESERVKSELLEKLNDSQQMSKIGSWEWDLQTNLIWWSDGTFRVYGITPQDFVPNFEANGEVIHSEDFESYVKAFEYSLQTGEPLDFDVRLVTNEGMLKYCNAKGKVIQDEFGEPIRFIGTIMDITERKQLTNTITRSRALLQSVIDTAPALIYAFDLEQKLIIANNALANLLDTHPAAIIGKRRHEFLPREIAERDDDHDRQVIRTGNPLEFEESGTFDGQLTTFLTKKSPLRDESGAIWGLVGISTDITERKQAEVTLMQSHQQLRSLATRLTQVEEAERRNLARELHDRVGQNLTALSINLNMIRSLIPAEFLETLIPFLDDSQNIIERTSGRIRNVMAELRPPELDDYGLSAALRWFAASFAARNQIDVETPRGDLRPRPPDNVETALFRIAQEALTNIAKHAQASQVTIALTQESDVLQMSISDNGVGFNPLDSKINTDRKRWGLLNLRERAEAIGGQLRIESQPGKGTRVIVEVPA